MIDLDTSANLTNNLMNNYGQKHNIKETGHLNAVEL